MKRFLPLLLAALVLASCGREINNKEAVKKGVLDYLEKRRQQTGLDMSLMNVEVTNVTFEKNEARATVAFVPRGASGGGMSMNYVLDRRGSQWVVRSRQDTGSPHGAGGMPGAMGGAGAAGANPHAGGVPGATPPAGMGGGTTPSMPAGHPPVSPDAGKESKKP